MPFHKFHAPTLIYFTANMMVFIGTHAIHTIQYTLTNTHTHKIRKCAKA